MPLALQGFLERLLSPEIIWVFVPLAALSIPIIAIASEGIKARIKAGERRELRELYERLAREKLDIIKTALAMGYQKADLAELDSRLEGLIGADKLKEILARDGQGELPSLELGSDGLEWSAAGTGRSRKRRREQDDDD